MVTTSTHQQPYTRLTLRCPPHTTAGKEVSFPEDKAAMEVAIRAEMASNHEAYSILERFPENGVSAYNCWEQDGDIGVTVTVPTPHTALVEGCLANMTDHTSAIITSKPVSAQELHPTASTSSLISLETTGVTVQADELFPLITQLAIEANSLAELEDDEEPALPFPKIEEFNMSNLLIQAQTSGHNITSSIVIPTDYAEITRQAITAHLQTKGLPESYYTLSDAEPHIASFSNAVQTSSSGYASSLC